MTDAVFNTQSGLSPAQSLGSNAGTGGAQAGLAVQIPPLVPPIRVGGAANLEGVGALAGKAVCPVSTPVISGGVTGAQTILSLLSTGAATMSNVP
jgi:hypothetical protein